MKVGLWMRDFQVLETEVQMIMDLLGRKVKIWVRFSSGKYPNELTSCCLTLPPISKRERTNEGKRGEACARVRGGGGNNLCLKELCFFFFLEKKNKKGLL